MYGVRKQTIIRGISIVLCLIALWGYLIPVMGISIVALNRTVRSMDVNIGNAISFRDELEDMFKVTESSDSALPALLGSEGYAEIEGKLTVFAGLYLAALVLLVILLLLLLANKPVKKNAVISVAALASFIYMGYTISNLAGDIIGILEQRIGFLSPHVDLQKMVNVTLENGFWLTIIAIGCLVVAQIKGALEAE